MNYSPNNVPADVSDLPRYVGEELLRISSLFGLITKGRGLPPLAVPPVRPREGDLASADGVGWNPGSGAGLYEYISGQWQKLRYTPPAAVLPPALYIGWYPENATTNGVLVVGQTTPGSQVLLDNRSAFSPSSGLYTVPEAGIYQFSVGHSGYLGAAATYMRVKGVVVPGSFALRYGDNYGNALSSVIVELAAGDTVTGFVHAWDLTTISIFSAFMSGVKIG